MNVKELYEKFNSLIPKSLSCDWDNDGLMCSPDERREAEKILCVLDVTEGAVDYAVENGFDLIISHHPLIFNKLSALNSENHIAKKVLKLLKNGISVFSFHTRADMFDDGVNTRLASLLGLSKLERFGVGEELMGCVGFLPNPVEIAEFCVLIKEKLHAPVVLSGGSRSVYKVALLGGDGKDFVDAAIECGADTYLSGRISYNIMAEADEMGINLIEAGHYYTEFHITEMFAQYAKKFAPDVYTEIFENINIMLN